MQIKNYQQKVYIYTKYIYIVKGMFLSKNGIHPWVILG